MISDEAKICFIDKVKMDFSAYDGKDSYSDGGIEDEILFHVKVGDEENFLRNDNRWPILCHLSPMRNFLLEWLPIDKNDSVLEIGCGLGALTGTLLSKGAHVEAVEISPRRAQICALRNHTAENLTIHVGNLNEMTFNKKFDFVLLIGVLEYTAKFTHTKNPYTDFLSKCKSFLKHDGALVIAIENRLGLEYLSGKPEDHTGRLFDGIKDYPQHTGIKTFSRREFIFDRYVYHIGRDSKSNEKIQKAVSAYANLKNGEAGLVCCDITAFGGAEDGVLLTNQGIYVHNPFARVNYFPYGEITSIELKGIIVKDIYINGFKVESPTGFGNTEKQNFASLLRHFKDNL